MNKTKIVLCAIGGVAVIAVLVFGYLAWDAYSAKSEREEDLDASQSRISRMLKAEVFPGEVSRKAYAANTAAVEKWLDAAQNAAKAGDRVFPEMTAASFKDMIVGQARDIVANGGGKYPGAVDGRLVGAKFAFGPFDQYVNGAKMPDEKDVIRLQRRWDDLMLFADVLAESGAAELVEIALKPSAEENAEAALKSAAERRKAAKRKAKKAKADAEAKPPITDTWIVTFRAKGPALVKTLNTLTATNRFIVVEDVAIGRDGDPILEAIGAGDKSGAKQEASASSRRSRRRNKASETAEKASEERSTRKGEVTNPLTEPPCRITLTCTVYDFRSLEDADAASVEEEAK